MRPDAATLFGAMEATWPPERRLRDGPVTLRFSRGGGSRVTAATLAGPPGEGVIAAAEAAMRAAGQRVLWQVRSGDDMLDAALAARGYRVMDPVWLYLAPIGVLAQEPPRISAFSVWPPLAIQREIWLTDGIGPDRVAVMERVAGPKAALLSRTDDRASGAGFVAVAEGIACLHALVVAEGFRRRGAARHMIARAAVWAQAQGADWLALAVTRANGPGNGLYASLGMEIVEHYHYRIREEG